MDHEATAVQALLVTLASSQHGVVTRAQLLHAGVTPQEIRDRVRSGALLREHRGVYRVGHRAPSLEARYMAGCLHAATRRASAAVRRRTSSGSSRATPRRPRSARA